VNSANPLASLRPIITLAGLVLVTGFLYWARPVLMPLALAVLFAFILAPAVNVLQRRGLGRIPSVIIVVFLSFSLLGSVGYFVGNQLAGLVRKLPDYKGVIITKIDSLSNLEGGGLFRTVQDTMHEVNAQLADANKEAIKQTEPESTKEDDRGSSPDKPLFTQTAASNWSGVATYAGPAAEGFATSILVLVLVVFMLVQREDQRNRLVRLIGHGQLIVTTRAIDEGARRISSFLLMQLFINAAFGTVLALALVGVSLFMPTPEDAATLRHYALLWGFVCGLMRFVPYIGTWLGAALLCAFTLATLHGWTPALVIFALFLVLELVAANVIEPILFSHSTGSSPLALLLAAAFWAWLWGPVGLLLSTPLTVVLTVIGKYVPQLHFLEVLLGDAPVLRPQVVLYQRLVASDQDEASDLVEEYLHDHSVENAYQDLLLPTLMLARQDIDRGELDHEHSRQVFQSIRDLVDEIAPAAQPAAEGANAPSDMVLGCPARDEVDEIALAMFGNLLRAQGRKIEVVSSKSLTAEVLAKVGDTCPGVVVISSVPPGGLAQTRYVCKRLKAQCTGVKVVVGRWGGTESIDQMKSRLQGSGVDRVGTTLAETRAEVSAQMLVAEATPAPQPQEASGELLASR
jgi:predicted PurR-regulated permease PerM